MKIDELYAEMDKAFTKLSVDDVKLKRAVLVGVPYPYFLFAIRENEEIVYASGDNKSVEFDEVISMISTYSELGANAYRRIRQINLNGIQLSAVKFYQI